MDPHNASAPSRNLYLAKRAPLVLEHAAGVEVQCREGDVWITQYGDSRDVVLRAGQSFVLDLPSSTVLCSSRGAWITLARPEGAGRAWFAPRASAALRGLEGRARIARYG
jgi:hypothetical protein